MSRLATLSFRDVVVTPYTDLLGDAKAGTRLRGGPHWPEWSTQTVARHCRYGGPIDSEPAAAEPKTILSGPVAWGGAIIWHFGHQISDFSMRLLPTLAEMPDARFAFTMRDDSCDQFSSWEATPEFFRGILGWYGIGRDRVDLIVEPTLVERLVVAPQAETLGGPPPEPWYLDLLDAHTRSRLGEVEQSGSLYVSRAGQHSRFAGESYLERVLETVGFRVLRPETVSLEDQLRAYASSKSIVFVAGSAIHGLQLMGRIRSDITVLSRIAERKKMGMDVLRPRTQSCRYVRAARHTVHSLDVAGRPAVRSGLGVLDLDQLFSVLPIREVWDATAFDAAVRADVDEWIESERQTRRWDVPGSPDRVGQSLRDAGLVRLNPVATSRLRGR